MKATTRAAMVVAAMLVAGLWDPGSAAPQQIVQAPARDNAPKRTGTSRIRGRVLAADNSTPVRRAVVRLNSSELREGRSKLTDVEGKYEFTDLPSGSYYLSAMKTGFIMGQPGATRPGDLGKTVKVGEAEMGTADDILLMRACVISGRVLDEFGDPVAGAQVSVLRSQSMGGVRRMMMTNNASTNDLGQFRAFGLQPGSYFISARASSMGGLDAESDDHTGYAPTYYPGTTNAGDAQPVQLATGQDLGGIDIMLGTTHVSRISGMALDSRGRPAANSGVNMMPIEFGMPAFGGPGMYGRVLPDGTFTVNNVPPGDYNLELRVSTPMTTPGTQGPPRMEYGRARVTVAGNDVTGVMIQASTGATVSGQVIFDGAAAPPKSNLQVIATPPPSLGPVSMGPTGPPATVAADGTFTLTGVFGERMFRLGGQPTGWATKGVYVNGRDVTDTPINLDGREQLTGVQIFLTDRITHLTGSVSDERGQPAESAYVLILPEEAARLTPGSRFVRTTGVRAGTPLKIDGLPAGDYIAVAFKSIPQPSSFDPYDPELLDWARKTGTRFSLHDAETRDVALKLVDPPMK